MQRRKHARHERVHRGEIQPLVFTTRKYKCEIGRGNRKSAYVIFARKSHLPCSYSTSLFSVHTRPISHSSRTAPKSLLLLPSCRWRARHTCQLAAATSVVRPSSPSVSALSNAVGSLASNRSRVVLSSTRRTSYVDTGLMNGERNRGRWRVWPWVWGQAGRAACVRARMYFLRNVDVGVNLNMAPGS